MVTNYPQRLTATTGVAASERDAKKQQPHAPASFASARAGSGRCLRCSRARCGAALREQPREMLARVRSRYARLGDQRPRSAAAVQGTRAGTPRSQRQRSSFEKSAEQWWVVEWRELWVEA